MLTARRAAGAVAATVAFATVLSGCSDDDGGGEPEPGPADVDVPEGITLTSRGSTVNLGQPASVVYDPDGAGRTVITVRVDDITRGKPGDIAGADGVPDGAVPFYVEASIHNAGPAALDGSRIPLYAVGSDGEDLDPAEVTGGAGGCEPLPVGDPVESGATVRGCLVFAVPQEASFGGVQVRTDDDRRPVTWKP